MADFFHDGNSLELLLLRQPLGSPLRSKHGFKKWREGLSPGSPQRPIPYLGIGGLWPMRIMR